MTETATSPESFVPQLRLRAFEVLALVALFFVYAGDAPPMVNEAHYLVKAKNYWQPDWCSTDLFAASGKAHVVFYLVFGWPTQFFSLQTSAWIGRAAGWTVLAIGLSRLSHACTNRLFASLSIAVLWIAGVEYGNLAGEWVVGGIEGKVPAYGFVLAAIAEIVYRRWNRVWILLGIASALHVLTGGWSVIAAMIAWAMTEGRVSKHCSEKRRPLITRWLFLGGAVSLLGIVPALQLTLGSDAGQSTQAARIYSYFRISHHLLPTAFLPWWYVRHGVVWMILFVSVWFQHDNRWHDNRWHDNLWRDNLWRDRSDTDSPGRRFLAFVLGSILIAIAGLVVGMLPAIDADLAARLLRYYWFRLSDAIVPLGMAVFVTRQLWEPKVRARRFAKLLISISIVLTGYSCIDRMLQMVPPSTSNRLLGWDLDADMQTRQQVLEDWIHVCQWAETSTPKDEVFLTPRHQQTFKWYSHRSEVVNWKDVPQDAQSLIEWKRRFEEVYPTSLGNTRVSIRYTTLRDFRSRYHVRYMIVDRRVVGDNLPLVRLYPSESADNKNYAVYELPR